MPRYTFLSLLLCVTAAAVGAQSGTEQNCGITSSTATEINGCNIKLEEEHPCSFADADAIMASAVEDDIRTVDIQYHACQVKSEADDECTEPETYVVYGNAASEIDGMLVQRQPGRTEETDRLCFVYDQHDGKSPTESCLMECFEISTNIGQEITFDTNEVAGLPSYGSASRNRHVTIVETGIRSGAMTMKRTSHFVALALGAFTLMGIAALPF